MLSIEALRGPVELPGLFVRLIGVAEAMGAIESSRFAGAAAASAPGSLTAVTPAEA